MAKKKKHIPSEALPAVETAPAVEVHKSAFFEHLQASVRHSARAALARRAEHRNTSVERIVQAKPRPD